MFIVEHQRAAAWRDLRIAVRQCGPNQAHIGGERRVDVAVKGFGNRRHDPAPAALSFVQKGMLAKDWFLRI
jgi:hypothetical protein